MASVHSLSINVAVIVVGKIRKVKGRQKINNK
jgi:hypothetical protein